MQPPADADAQGRWLARLLDDHGGPLAVYAAQWTTAPDDCVQEAFVELAGCNPPPDSPVAWLYRVVKRRALNDARGQQRRHRRERHAWQNRLQAAGNPGEQRDLLDAVAALPDQQREIVLLKTWGGLTYEEMADVLGDSASTLHRRYAQAIDLLREQWELPCTKTTAPK